VGEDFTWRDGERIVRFGRGALEDAPRLFAERGLDGFVLLTTERAAGGVPALAARASAVVHVPSGRVDEISAALLSDAGDRPMVALGGGRVVDTAKAIAGARGGRCAAVPTTLSGAEMTAIHRTPAGIPGARLVRPGLVVAEPDLMASAASAPLAASAMNALAHAMEALYTPFRNPAAELTALRAAELIAAGAPRDPPDRESLALGAILAGYASGSAGIAVHHAVCQTIVRTAGTPHAQTNAVMLPRFAAMMSTRAPAAMGLFARALGDPDGASEAAGGRVAKLAARSGHTRLSPLGVEEQQLVEVARAVQAHPALSNTPDPPVEDELLAVMVEAL
jgi:alcohol dehydrogenase class IV